MLPDVYVALIKFLTSIPEVAVESTYSSWPIPEEVVSKWKSFLPILYSKLFDHECIYTHKEKWATVKMCFFFNEEERNQLRFQENIARLFTNYQQSLALPPKQIMDILTSNVTTLKVISRSIAKNIIKKNEATYNMFSPVEQIELLSFVLHNAEDYNDLKEYKVFPLKFGAGCTDLTQSAYILSNDEDIHLFPMISERILFTDGVGRNAMNFLCDSGLYEMFIKLSATKDFNSNNNNNYLNWSSLK